MMAIPSENPSLTQQTREANSSCMLMSYYVIYDGYCNLCVTLIQILEKLDGGRLFAYIPMQKQEALNSLGIRQEDCNLGIILVDAEAPKRRWQGSEAIEEIGRLMPMGELFVATYQKMPGFKQIGDIAYEQIRDNRYTLFGKRSDVYQSACFSDFCSKNNSEKFIDFHKS